MATQNTDLKEAKKDAIMTPDMYRSMFLRQFTSQCSQSYDKMMAMGFMYTIQKPLRKIYPNDDDYYAALDRHTEFFNITPHVLPFVAGLTVSMEEQAAADKNFDTSSINAMKVGLMGRFPASAIRSTGVRSAWSPPALVSVSLRRATRSAPSCMRSSTR